MHNLAHFRPKMHNSDQKTLQIPCKFLPPKTYANVLLINRQIFNVHYGNTKFLLGPS